MSSKPLKQPTEDERTYLAHFAYDGTDYAGWQYQPNARTLQQTLEESFTQVTGLPVRLRACGRTDAGVHALDMPADFTLPWKFDLVQLTKAWNAVSPADIAVTDVHDAPAGFSARFAARRRTYRYALLNRPQRSIFLHRWCWHLADKLDINAIREAMSALVGEHDFTTFRAADCEANHAVRSIYRVDIADAGVSDARLRGENGRYAGAPEAGLMVVTITGNAFLKHQVRSIVGTLVEVGRGKMTPEDFARALAARDRRLAGPTAPAHGLTFVGVEFDADEIVI